MPHIVIKAVETGNIIVSYKCVSVYVCVTRICICNQTRRAYLLLAYLAKITDITQATWLSKWHLFGLFSVSFYCATLLTILDGANELSYA